MKYSDEQRIDKIIETWESVKKEISDRDITKESLLNDIFTQWAITTPLYNIGEQVYNLSSEFKQSYPEIKWNLVSGLRHRLVHNYEGINWSIIVEIVFEEMDVFINELRKISKSK